METINAEFSEDLVNCADESIDLFDSVAWCNSDSETFFATCNGGVIDRLDVNVVLRKKFVRGSLSQRRIANEYWDDVRGTGSIESEIDICG